MRSGKTNCPAISPVEKAVWAAVVKEVDSLADSGRVLVGRCRRLKEMIMHIGGCPDKRRELLTYLLREGYDGEPTLEGFEQILVPPPEQKCEEKARKRKVKTSLMGPKTLFMQGQLKAFKKYLTKMGYKGDTSQLYARARGCWIGYQTEWDLAKCAKETKRGYSCPKALADAYRNLPADQFKKL